MFGACLGGEHTEDARTASDIKDSLAPEQMWVVDDCGTIGSRPDDVLEHLLVDA